MQCTVLGLLIPLSWFISAWKHFPQFWNSGKVAERRSGGRCCEQPVLEPRRPENCSGNITNQSRVIQVEEFGSMEEIETSKENRAK